MPPESAGILLFRKRKRSREVFLVHPGGPFWRNKDLAAWTIPKGKIEPGEDPLTAAKREFKEETGFDVDGEFKLLGRFRQPSGKQVTAFAAEGDCDPDKLVSDTFPVMWPPKSGKYADFPEIDRGEWFTRAVAERKILKGQKPILDVLFGRPRPLPKIRIWALVQSTDACASRRSSRMPKAPNREDQNLLRMLKPKPKPHAPLKAKAKPSRGVSAGHLPQRADAVSGKAGRTPATPPKKAKPERS